MCPFFVRNTAIAGEFEAVEDRTISPWRSQLMYPVGRETVASNRKSWSAGTLRCRKWPRSYVRSKSAEALQESRTTFIVSGLRMSLASEPWMVDCPARFAPHWRSVQAPKVSDEPAATRWGAVAVRSDDSAESGMFTMPVSVPPLCSHCREKTPVDVL